MSATGKYDDIMYLAHHVSARRLPMPIADRAAQFSPFAALTGYEAVIEETGRVTDSRIELDESEKAMLNEKLQLIAESVDAQPLVTVTCFLPDAHKLGGSYVQRTGQVRKIDAYEKVLIMDDGTRIPIQQIYQIILNAN